jgi:enoyl-CoA hydratase/carnithine racemase
MTANFAVTDGIAAIVLDDAARRNALGFDTLASIAQAVRQAEQVQAGAIVISATGPVFSAGADFNDLTGTSADIDFDTAVARATAALRRTHIPVIAAVHGPCLGAAVDLVVSADVVIASTAARFEVPAVRLGILYNPEALAVMRGRLNGAMMRQLMLGISVSATDAAMGGMVARVVDTDELPGTVDQLVRQLCAGQRGAFGATKELLNQLDVGPVHLDQWTPLRRCLLDTPERHQAIAARKRPTPS